MSQFRTTPAVDGRIVLAVSGEVDLANAGDLLETGNECFNRASTKVLVIDLAKVTFMDSTALSTLISLRNTSIRLDKQLELARVPSRVRQLLAITKLDGVFLLVDGTDSSLSEPTT